MASSENGIENGTKLPIIDPEETTGNPHFNDADDSGDLLKGAGIRIPVPWGWIAGKQWGTKTGLPVLGLHGWMDNAGTFDKLAPLLSPSLNFVAVELPGHGLSSHLPAGVPYHFIDWVLVVRRIVTHLKWTKFSIIGHSMGAGVGALYASIFTSDVEHLVLLDLAKPITGDTTNIARKLESALTAFLAIEEKITPVPPSYTYFDALDRLMKATSGALTEESAKCLLVRGTRQVDEDKWTFTRDLRLRSPTIIRWSHEDSYNILKEIRCRVLLLRAKDGIDFEPKEVTQSVIEIYQKYCKDFQVVDVAGNHFFHLNNPTETAQLVNKFLSEQKACL